MPGPDLCRVALEIRNELVDQIKQQIINTDVGREHEFQQHIDNLNSFKESKHWFHNFMKRKNVSIVKPIGELRLLSVT